jgi:membrane-associated phospholipid phosphatase
MRELPFDSELIRSLAAHRSDPLTGFFSFFTYLGDIEGYILLVALVYAVWDKRLAIRLATLVLLAMSLNHQLKMLIANPRPFVVEGTYAQQWAVTPAKAAGLATEYSTPSGHAMGSSAFWGFVYATVRHPAARIACVVAILLIGLSRPYLGVHYLEDVLLGWLLGVAIAVLAARYVTALGERWGRLSIAARVAIVAAASLALGAATVPLDGGALPGEPLAWLSYTGFLMGVVVADPLESRTLDFDPRRGSVAQKALRFVLGVALVIGTLVLLDGIFAALADDYSTLGYLLRYVRYALAALAGLYLAPLLFVKLGLAQRR